MLLSVVHASCGGISLCGLLALANMHGRGITSLVKRDLLCTAARRFASLGL